MKLLSQIKKDLEFNRNLSGLISALKEISIAQYHIMEKKIQFFDKIFTVLEEFFEIVDIKDVDHPLLNAAGRIPCAIAITSDSGLLGPLNMQVMSLALREVKENNAKLVIIGERGKVYAQENNVSFVSFSGIRDEARAAQAEELRDYIVAEELANRLGAVKIFYPYAASLINQRIKELDILPLIRASGTKSTLQSEVIMESSVEDVAAYLAYLLLGYRFYEIFGLSRLAEMAARFVHLEESGHKLEKIEKEVKLQYFRQRHELIDRNMRELFAARLAFK